MECKDSFVWAFTKDENYTVKSGNWLASQLVWCGLVVPPVEQEGNALKARVWSLKTLPKIKCSSGGLYQGVSGGGLFESA